MDILTVSIWFIGAILLIIAAIVISIVMKARRGVKVRLAKPAWGMPKGTTLWVTEVIPDKGYGVSTKPGGLTEYIIERETFKIM